MIKHKLSALAVRNAKPGRYYDGEGLWLYVTDTSRKWVLRYTWNKRAREMGLGPTARVSLAEARAAAEKHRVRLRQVQAAAADRLADGADPAEVAKVIAQADPIDARRKLRVVLGSGVEEYTFEDVANKYMEAHQAEWKNPKHREQWMNTLTGYVYPIFGKKPVSAVDTGLVMRVLEEIWTEKTETASRVRGRIEAVLDYATARGWRSGDNPARWRGHLEHMLSKKAKVQRVEHHAALPWAKVGTFMESVSQASGIGATALRFLILTAARTGEVVGAQWREIDMDAAVWTVPAARMKAGREHRVPLSEPALAILREMAEKRTGSADTDFVFPGQRPKRPLSQMAFSMLMRRLGYGDLTVHGFRSTFRDWCGESTNYPRELAEAALAHTLKDKTEAAYARSDLLDKRRSLMAAWGAFCSRPEAPAGDVVPMRRAS